MSHSEDYICLEITRKPLNSLVWVVFAVILVASRKGNERGMYVCIDTIDAPALCCCFPIFVSCRARQCTTLGTNLQVIRPPNWLVGTWGDVLAGKWWGDQPDKVWAISWVCSDNSTYNGAVQ